MAADFLDALCAASNVPKERVFCVPGNHDIDRERQQICFRGARAILNNTSSVDMVLEGGEDLETLLKREENYRRFQDSYFSGQKRTSTDDGLGYVARLIIDDLRISIIGLDSAWLANGGNEDLGKIIIGERQVIDATNLVRQFVDPAHIVIAMAHHPLHYLQDFDRRSVMYRIEEFCQFMHCGHLHEPETRTTGVQQGTGCLMLSAGASFQTRQSDNSYAIVSLDLLRAVRSVKTFQYRPAQGSFSSQFSDEYPIEVMSNEICDVAELASAVGAYEPSLANHSFYLSSLLLNRKTDLVTPVDGGYSFASLAVLQEASDDQLIERTEAFLRFRNVLHVLYQQMPLQKIFQQHGELVAEYGATLLKLYTNDKTLSDRLALQERDARALATARPKTALSHTTALLTDLAAEQDWVQLRKQAERHMESPEPEMRTLAKRMMAWSLANSDESRDNDVAIDLYRSIVGTKLVEFSDIGNFSILLAKCGNYDEAKGGDNPGH